MGIIFSILCIIAGLGVMTYLPGDRGVAVAAGVAIILMPYALHISD